MSGISNMQAASQGLKMGADSIYSDGPDTQGIKGFADAQCHGLNNLQTLAFSLDQRVGQRESGSLLFRTLTRLHMIGDIRDSLHQMSNLPALITHWIERPVPVRYAYFV